LPNHYKGAGHNALTGGKMNDLSDASMIKDKIHVMLDSDIAELYGVETKVLNQAVKRNSLRFPAFERRSSLFKVTNCDLERQIYTRINH